MIKLKRNAYRNSGHMFHAKSNNIVPLVLFGFVFTFTTAERNLRVLSDKHFFSPKAKLAKPIPVVPGGFERCFDTELHRRAFSSHLHAKSVRNKH